MRTIPRRDSDQVAATMFLRPQRPDDHRDFERVLPWCTPLFVYTQDGMDWVRWSMPRSVGARFGLEGGCACCGASEQVEGDNDDYHIDTALKETDWWLATNQYAVSVAKCNTPPEGEMK